MRPLFRASRGTRSLTRSSTSRSLFRLRTRTRESNGRSKWAVVNWLLSNGSPLAVGSAADRGASATAREHGHDEAGEEHPPIHDRTKYHGVTVVNLCSGRRAGARSLGQKLSAARCRSIDTLWPLLGASPPVFQPRL